MKALTICQPYAELILRGDKLVENRNWPVPSSPPYRGPLLIHAGKSRSWLTTNGHEERDVEYDIPFSAMAFGAIVGVVELVRDFHIGYLLSDRCDDLFKPYAAHAHTFGPYCWILGNPRRFDLPISYRGKQGLFDIPDYVVQEALTHVRQG